MRKLNTIVMPALCLCLASLSLGLPQNALAEPSTATQTQKTQAVDASHRLSEVLKGLERYKAAFNQMSLDSAGTVLQESTGWVHMAKPGNFEWRIQTPYHQRLVVQEKTLWIVDDDLEQVTVQTLHDEVVHTPAFLLSAAPDQLEHLYRVQYTQLPGQAERFTLEPRQQEETSVFERMNLVFFNGLLIEMDFHDSLGQRTAINFTNAELNPSIDKEVFSVTVPDGYDVIEDV